MISDPPDGQMPALTPEALNERAAASVPPAAAETATTPVRSTVPKT